jgi:hypothetical protein
MVDEAVNRLMGISVSGRYAIVFPQISGEKKGRLSDLVRCCVSLTAGALAAIGLMLGIALRPLFRAYVTIPITIFICKRIKSDRIKRFLLQEVEAYRD